MVNFDRSRELTPAYVQTYCDTASDIMYSMGIVIISTFKSNHIHLPLINNRTKETASGVSCQEDSTIIRDCTFSHCIERETRNTDAYLLQMLKTQIIIYDSV